MAQRTRAPAGGEQCPPVLSGSDPDGRLAWLEFDKGDGARTIIGLSPWGDEFAGIVQRARAMGATIDLSQRFPFAAEYLATSDQVMAYEFEVLATEMGLTFGGKRLDAIRLDEIGEPGADALPALARLLLDMKGGA